MTAVCWSPTVLGMRPLMGFPLRDQKLWLPPWLSHLVWPSLWYDWSPSRIPPFAFLGVRKPLIPHFSRRLAVWDVNEPGSILGMHLVVPLLCLSRDSITTLPPISDLHHSINSKIWLLQTLSSASVSHFWVWLLANLLSQHFSLPSTFSGLSVVDSSR